MTIIPPGITPDLSGGVGHSAFTPGPWETRRHSRVFSPLGIRVADVTPAYKGSLEFDANIRLIAAAPDLLDALSRLADESDRFEAGHIGCGKASNTRLLGTLCAARAAIAKALGREAASPASASSHRLEDQS